MAATEGIFTLEEAQTKEPIPIKNEYLNKFSFSSFSPFIQKAKIKGRTIRTGLILVWAGPATTIKRLNIYKTEETIFAQVLL